MGIFDDLKKLDDIIAQTNRRTELPGKQESKPVDAEVYPAIPEDAQKLKELLSALHASCIRVSGVNAEERVRIIGEDIMRLLTGRYGDNLNMEAIAAMAASLLYTMEETEKRSFKKVMESDEPKPWVPCEYCRSQPAFHEISLTMDNYKDIYFCSPKCRLDYYEQYLMNRRKKLQEGTVN